MTNGRTRSKEFWFEFDNVFNVQFGLVPDEVSAAYDAIPPQHHPARRWRAHRDAHTYPDGFRAEMNDLRDPLLFLSAKQVELLDRHFGGDPDAERTAFEQFGEGVLFDDRRPKGDKIHKMDYASDGIPRSYHVWHPFIMASVMVGADPGRWLQIDRTVALAWAIQSEARPVEDAPDNPGLLPARLVELRSIWLNLSFDQLDREFDSFPFPAGMEPGGAGPLSPGGPAEFRRDLRAETFEDPAAAE